MNNFLFDKIDSEELAYNYLYGIGVKKDEKKIFEYYMRDGKGVNQNYSKAFTKHLKSTNMGYMIAMYNIAQLYRYKEGSSACELLVQNCRSLLKTNKSPDHINPELKRILNDDSEF
ncbi:putative Non-specific protein-tyrosine kinase [Gigaspora margarita]|uniref:Putative Non-specific protein-tyrosine kinase n=1 Tax=Gigaspora margarita TaxID=4874 RepID=A0A8H3X471_GIGMA|nr:putative Non-specific protein-tyrosine kinase [Gigaspora margarita]